MKTPALLLAFLGSASAVCPNSCSNSGTCGKYDMCTCHPGFMGADCSERICPYARAWVTTASGDLNFDGDVVDHTVYNIDSEISAGYSTLITQGHSGGTHEFWPAYAGDKEGHFYMECANRGLCDRSSGECACFAGYEGSSCQRMVCPNDCSGKGVCQSTSYLTKWPSTTTSAWYNTVQTTSDYAMWDGNMAMACQCDPGYSGPDCSIRMCPVGDDRLTQTNQVYETQFVDVFSKCEGTTGAVDTAPANCVTASATTGISGSIRLKYTDHFGEVHTTDLIDGVAAFDGDTAHALAANAQAALRALDNNVISSTLTVRAAFCEILSEDQHEVAAGVLDPEPGLGAGYSFRALGIACNTVADLGNNVYQNNKAVVVGTTVLDTPLAKEDAAANCGVADNFGLIQYPQCIRLVVNFNNMPGDIPDLAVDTTNVAYGDSAGESFTNAQSANANVDSSVTDQLAVTTAQADLSYTAPKLVQVKSAAADCKVETASGATIITMGSGGGDTINAAATNTFHVNSKIEIFCGHDGTTGTRSLGMYTVSAVLAGTAGTITLVETIPLSTLSTDCGWDAAASPPAVAANAKVVVQAISHVVVTGNDDDTAAEGGTDTSVNLQLMVDAHTGTATSVEFGIEANIGATKYRFAAAFKNGYETAKDSAAAGATTSYVILDSESTVSLGANKAAASAGTIIGSAVATDAAGIDGTGEVTGATVTYNLDGKGTTEAYECGARGLCDTEAGECKCFSGYSGNSCSEQAALAM